MTSPPTTPPSSSRAECQWRQFHLRQRQRLRHQTKGKAKENRQRRSLLLRTQPANAFCQSSSSRIPTRRPDRGIHQSRQRQRQKRNRHRHLIRFPRRRLHLSRRERRRRFRRNHPTRKLRWSHHQSHRRKNKSDGTTMRPKHF